MVKAITVIALCIWVTFGAQAADKEVAVAGITFPVTITDDQWKVFQANVRDRADPPFTLKMMI